ncbi:MAG: 2Fe-2S iron-sulfur cluster-binding protein [Pseudomonadota bacterium]
MSGEEQTAKLVIARGEDGEIHYTNFSVPFEPGASVLDGLMWIKAEQDPTLAFRFSCINANVCRECTMMIDGEVTYACTARLKRGETKISPLPSKKHIRDLVTATVPSGERLKID